MFKEKDTYLEIEEFKKYGVKAIYTKKNAGNMSDYCKSGDSPSENRKKILKTLNLENKIQIFSYQTHTNNVKIIESNEEKYIYEEIDGFITSRNDVVLVTFYADCLPIFLYDTKKKAIGVLHSGWPGSYKEIIKEAIELLKKNYDSNPKDILMGLGVGIDVNHYEVGEDFYNNFVTKFGSDSNVIQKSFKKSELDGKYYFDNITFNFEQAIRLGIKKENIVISSHSTWNEKFHSYRRDKKNSGRAAAIISFID